MQRDQIAKIVAATVAAVLIVPLSGASAAAQEKTVNEEILEILRKDGTIDETQYQELAAEAKAEEAEAKVGGPKDFTIDYKNGLRINRNDGLVKLKLGGRIQADFASIDPDHDLNKSQSNGDGEGTEFRRARLYMSGELDERIIFKAQYDFAPSGTAFDDVYIGMTDLGEVIGTVKVGHFKEPFGLEEMASSKYVTFMERALPGLFDDGRAFGIGFESHDESQRVTWALGIFAPTDSRGSSFTHDTRFDLTGRVTGLPVYENDGEQLLHLGLAFTQQFRDDISTRYRQRPEAHLAQRYLDTGDIRTDDNTLLGVEAAWVQGPFSLQAEWKQALLNVKKDTTNTTTGSTIGGKGTSYVGGGYVDASYFLTGEHRAYNTSEGVFARVSPLRPFDPASGAWGAVQVAGRLSYLDLNDSGLYGGKATDVTAGVNWYLYSYLRLTANYVYSMTDTGPSLNSHGGDIHVFEARAQIEF